MFGHRNSHPDGKSGNGERAGIPGCQRPPVTKSPVTECKNCGAVISVTTVQCIKCLSTTPHIGGGGGGSSGGGSGGR
ncbi:hypothetical protein OF83DRAFT_696598 [Amylostereum chailletii]|nr:hypothetical protein OF83DRAFT_696598 [Amylostereum chailletii]